jgi:hypothetical protein
MTTRQIKTYGTNYGQEALYGLNSRDAYICANSTITRGVCGPPTSLENCFDTYSSIKVIAEQLGFLNSGASGSCGGNSGYNYNLWKGATVPQTNLLNTFQPIDVYLNDPSTECDQVNTNSDFGPSWLGCLWGTPDAPYSCTCPDIGPNYAAYLKLRLNVATFWNTPKITPVKRAEFLDALKYCSKVDVTVAGDFTLKIGKVVKIKADGASGYPYASSASKLNGLYYIIGVKHVITNSGTHETALSLTQLPENQINTTGASNYDADYT